jgi:hypothetical protein
MITFILGFMLGGTFGVLIMGIIVGGSRNEK